MTTLVTAYWDRLLVFIFSLVYFISIFSKTCKLYLQNTFDTQALFIWDYNVAIGMLPYKEIFYPYGILSYYKDHMFLATLVTLFILSISVTFLYILVKKIFRNIYITVLTVLLFCCFVTVFTGWEVFSRYGVLFIVGLFTAYYSYAYTIYKPVQFVGLGTLCGLCFSAMPDIGIYAAVVSFIILCLHPILIRSYRQYSTFLWWKEKVKQLVFFIIGVGLGSIPLVVYLLITHTFVDFFHASLQLSDIALYAKTPFFPGLRSIENISVLTVLFIAIFVLTYRVLYTKKSLALIHYYEASMVLMIILLEQKSIIRSIDRTITFVGFLLFCFLLYDLLVFLKGIKKGTLSVSLWYSIMLLVAAVLLVFFSFFGFLRTHVYNSGFERIYASPSECRDKNKTTFTKDKVVSEVVAFIKNRSDFTGLVFSYPFDPIFYVLFEQKTPYYSNTYDSSSEIAQKKQVAYIEKNNIRYVIIDTKVTALQDQVPEYIRSNTVLHYLLTNFTVVKRINTFLVLQKSSSLPDVFTNPIVPLSYKQYLLHVDLQQIPATEGFYKYGNHMSASARTFSSPQRIQGNEIVVVYAPMKLQIQRNDGVIAHLPIIGCRRSPCLVHLARIPIFFSKNDTYTYVLMSDKKDPNLAILYQKFLTLW